MEKMHYLSFLLILLTGFATAFGLFVDGSLFAQDYKDLKIVAFFIGPAGMLLVCGVVGYLIDRPKNHLIWLFFVFLILVLNIIAVVLMAQSPYNQWGAGAIPWLALTVIEYVLIGGIMVFMIVTLISKRRNKYMKSTSR